MIDIRELRRNPGTYLARLARKGAGELGQELLDLDAAWRATTTSAESLRAKLKSSGRPTAEQREELQRAKEQFQETESKLAELEARRRALLDRLPNPPADDVPSGGEECNVIVHEWGTPRAEQGLRPHWEIAEKLGIIDLARGAKISGSGFVVYRGAGARLVRSLMNLFLDVHTSEHGYEEVWVPVVVNRASMTGTAQLPKFEDDMYGLRDEDMFLIPTAEVPVTNLYRDEMLDVARLPRGFCAYSPCFRREAGSAGKDTRGVLRVHEFDKVELVRYSAPENSAQEHELMTRHATTLLERLGLPYRVKLLAAGDTGFASAKTYDLETYAPGVGTWLEVSSSSTFTDFQARRANIRFRPAPGEKPRFVHTLNASGLAFPRIIATVIEHYQQPDGSITVPEVLRPYLGTDTIR